MTLEQIEVNNQRRHEEIRAELKDIWAHMDKLGNRITAVETAGMLHDRFDAEVRAANRTIIGRASNWVGQVVIGAILLVIAYFIGTKS